VAKAWAEIDESAWVDNFTAIQKHVAPLKLMPVVKANAYGMGARRTSSSFRACGATHLAVSCLDEGLELLGVGADILILGASLGDEIPLVVAHGLIPSVQDVSTARALSGAAARAGKRLKIHIKIDSGMGRFGIPLEQARATVAEIAQLPSLDLDGIFSHLAVSRSRDRETQNSVADFAVLIRDLAAQGIRFAYRHVGNSTAIAGLPEVCGDPFNMVRSGIDLQGGHVSALPRPYQTRPVLTLKARLLAVRHMLMGAPVGYGRTYRVTKAAGERIGVVSIGYADGYSRHLSNKGVMLVRGQRCPVTGLVCMDYSMISLESVPDAQVGDEVVVIGRQGNDMVSLAELARAAETIPYELMCGLGPRVERRYVARAGG